MSNYASLKATLNANIKTNGNQEITGSVLNSVLNAMISSLGAGYQFAGIATPEMDLGTPDQRIFYIATTPGNYSNGASLDDKDVAILRMDNSWQKLTLNVAKKDVVDALDHVVGTSGTGRNSYQYDVNPGDKIVAISDTRFMVYVGATSSSLSFLEYRPDNRMNAFTYVVPDGIHVVRFYFSSNFDLTYAVNKVYYGLVKGLSDIDFNVEQLLQKKVSASDFYGVTPPVNLIYLNVLSDGYLVDQINNNVVDSPYYYTTDFIEVTPGSKYALAYARFSMQFDERKVKINGTYTDHNNAQSSVITANAGAKYVRMTFQRSRINLAQFVAGETVPEYTPYEVDVPFIRIPFKNVTEVSIPLGKMTGAQQNSNLFDKNVVVSGYIQSDGSIAANDSYRSSDYIPVTPGETYSLGRVRFVAQYDKSQKFISGTYADKNSAAQSSIVASGSAAYIRVSITTLNFYRGQVNLGASLAVYDDYGYYLPNLIVSKSKFQGKKAVCFGDSITGCVDEMDLNNWCMYLKQATGMDVINQGYWSGRVAYSDDSAAVINAFAFYELVDSIVSGNWSRQDIIYSTPGYEQHAAQLEKLKQIDFTKVDFLTIALGTNDLSSDTPFEIEGQPMSVESVNGAFRYTISKLLTNYPQLHIIIMTPIYRFTPSTGDDYMVNGRGVQSFVDDYKELGKELRIPVLNMFNDIGVNKYNRSYYWGANGGDGLHPISTMKEVMGNKVAGFLTSVY